jgi:hypothetical protein
MSLRMSLGRICGLAYGSGMPLGGSPGSTACAPAGEPTL